MANRLVSPTQEKALEALVAGSVIHVVRHVGRSLSDSAFIAGTNKHQRISTATVEALRVQGWLTETEDPGYLWRSSRYVISDKGREALKQAKQFETGARRQRSLRRAGVSWKTKR